MSSLLAAWQGALAAEQQAYFGYALLGPQLSGAAQTLAIECSDAHDGLVTTTADGLAAAGRRPVEPHADYPSLYPVTDARSARALAARLEDDCAAAWRYLYAQAASTDSAAARTLRRAAQDALTASAVRAVRWRRIGTPGRATTAFPGIS